MAYTKRYFLERVKAVNEIYLEYHNKGVTNEYIYENYIKTQFYISKTTFYNYLTIPYNALLKQLDRADTAKQLVLNL